MKKVLFLFSACSFFPVTSIFSQNIGIGTVTPTRARLEVHGVEGSGNTSAIFGGDGNGISMQRNWPTIGFNQFRDNASGNGRFMATGYAAIQSLDPLSGIMGIDMFPYGLGNASIPSSTRAISIAPTGYVGLGGAYPNASLQLPNTLDNRKIVLWETANNDNQYYGFGINGGTLRYNIDAPGAVHRFYAGASSVSSNLLFSIWGNKQVLVSNSGGGGFFGINLDNAPYTLSLKQAGGTGIYLQEAASGTNWEFRAGYTAATSYAVMYLRHNGSDIGFFRPTGEYVPYSDKRLKTNIEVMPPTLAKMLQLQPKIFEFSNNNNRHEKTYGFIAQEVKELFPELVFVNENPDPKGVPDPHAMSYSGIGVIAVRAIQEQQSQIKNLQIENEELKRKFAELEKKILSLQQSK